MPHGKPEQNLVIGLGAVFNFKTFVQLHQRFVGSVTNLRGREHCVELKEMPKDAVG